MALDSILSFFKPNSYDPTAVNDQALTQAKMRGPHVAKLGAPPRAQTDETLASENSAVKGPVDQVQISTQAAFVLAASQYDPTALTETDTQRLADGLLKGKAISSRDRTILTQGPKSGLASADPYAPRNLLADFQNDISKALGQNDFRTVESSSRAVSILGRVASLREIIT